MGVLIDSLPSHMPGFSPGWFIHMICRGQNGGVEVSRSVSSVIRWPSVTPPMLHISLLPWAGTAGPFLGFQNLSTKSSFHSCNLI